MPDTTTLLHISDLHMGWPYVPAVGDALVEAAHAIKPDAVVISGDYVQRGDFVALWEQARDYVARLPGPQIGVPGNHDIPLWNPLRRAVSAFDRYREFICEDLDPVLSVPGATIAGINTARPWVVDLGHVAGWQLDKVEAALAAAPPGALRVVTLHHPLLPQTECGFFRHHVYGWRRAIERLAAAGAEVVLSGHNHYPKCVPLAQHAPGGEGLVLAQAGTATSKRLKPASGFNTQSFNVLRANGRELEVQRWSYARAGFALDATSRFERRRAPETVRAR